MFDSNNNDNKSLHDQDPPPREAQPPSQGENRSNPPQQGPTRPGDQGVGGYPPGQTSGYSNRYDPYGNRYEAGRQSSPGGATGQDQQPQQPYNPYQYNANSGWQQYANNSPKDEWKFASYDQFASPRREKKKRSKGMVVFTVAIICVLSISLVAVSGYGIWSGMNGPAALDSDEDGEDPFTGLDLGPEGEQEFSGVENVPQIQIYNRPVDDDSIGPDGKMSIPQVAESVLPSVVGVIKFDNSTFIQAAGQGSGIVMTEDGYIITNAHVVAGGTDFKVELNDGTPYDAKLIGYDTPTDLAVLKIEAENLVAARFGDSEQIRVGETVIAIGNPGSMLLKGSVTQGIVSAVNREIDASSYSMTYIQTDAAINPGNSGGALCNEYGQVVGINSAKIVAEGFEGIGFAIPITEATPILQDLMNNGRVTGRVKLGVSVYEIDQVDARNFNLPMGIQIVSIEPGSFIAGTNAQKGDIIIAIDGEDVITMTDLRGILNTHQVGDTVSLTLYRPSTTGRGAQFTVDVQLIEDVD